MGFFVKLYLMDSYPKSKVGELEIREIAGSTAVVPVGFVNPSKLVSVVHFPVIASVWRDILTHCGGNHKKKCFENSREIGMGGAVVVGRVGTGVLIATGVPGK